MSRANDGSQDYLQEKVTYLRTTLDDLRQSQTFGSSNVRTYELFRPMSASGYDATFTNLTATTPQCIEVTLTPTNALSNVTIAFDATFDIYDSGSSGYYFNFDPLLPSGGVQKWRLWLMSRSGTVTTVNINFTFWTVSPGTYSAVAVAP